MDDQPFEANLGLSRRTLLRRSAVVGGTLVWAAPAVQTLAKPAFAATGSAACQATVCAVLTNGYGGVLGHLTCTAANAGDQGCLCKCALGVGQCNEPSPCTVPLTCTDFEPGPCPS